MYKILKHHEHFKKNKEYAFLLFLLCQVCSVKKNNSKCNMFLFTIKAFILICK